MLRLAQETVPLRNYDDRPDYSSDYGDDLPERRTKFVQGRRVAFASGVTNLLASIIGSGVLGLPYMLRQTGVLGGMLVLCGTCVIVYYALHLLLCAGLASGCVSWSTLVSKNLGWKGHLIATSALILQNFGGMATYCTVIRDMLAYFVPDPFISRTILSVVIYVVLLPISLTRRMESLAWVSGAATAAVGVFAFIVIGRAALLGCRETLADPEMCAWRLWPSSAQDIAVGLPTACFSYQCAGQLLPVYEDLRRADSEGRTYRSKDRPFGVVRCALGLAFCCYASVSLSGYSLFGKQTEPDLLLSISKYAAGDWLSGTVLGLFVVAIAAHIPIAMFPFRAAVAAAIWPPHPGLEISDLDGLSGHHSVSTVAHFAITLGGITVALLCALYIPQITLLFSVVGSVGSTTLLFVLPALCYIQACLSPENIEAVRRHGSLYEEEMSRSQRGSRPSSAHSTPMQAVVQLPVAPDSVTPLLLNTPQNNTFVGIRSVSPSPVRTLGEEDEDIHWGHFVGPYCLVSLGFVIFVFSWYGILNGGATAG